MTRSHLLVLALFAAGCKSKDAKPAATAPPAPAASDAAAEPAAAAPKAPALPPELASVAKTRTLQAGPFAWPEGGTSAVVTENDQSDLVWHSPAGDGELHLSRAIASGAVKDVTKDGKPELALFAKPPAQKLEWFDDQAMTWIIGIDPKSKKPAEMWLLEHQLLGATDVASLDKELAALSTFGVGKDTSPVKVIARLPLATPAELQALVGKQGLKLCKRQGEKKSCSPVAQNKIDAKKAKAIVDTAGVIAAFSPDPDGDNPEALQPPACEPEEKNPKLLDCSSSVGGPGGGQWVFEKTDAGLRLAEVWSWAEDS